ncbi:hypothetical protein ACOZ82_001970 [Vibrio parahaemolyticus]
MKNYFKSLSAEQPDVRFFGLRLVKFVSVIFGSVFIFTLAVTLLDTSALDWKLNVEGLKFFFLDAMKVPGSILAFYLAVLGLIGANHRSEQTKKQIEEARVQNDFANYYKHQEEFLKYVEEINHKGRFISSNMRALHQTLFPKSRVRDFSVGYREILNVDNLINSFVKSVPLLFDPDEHESALKALNDVKVIISHDFNLRNSSAVKVHTVIGDNDPWGDGSSLYLHKFIDEFVDMVSHVDALFKFDPDYVASEKMFIFFLTNWLEIEEVDFGKAEGAEALKYKQLCHKIEAVELHPPR